ncbi:WD40 repeat-like protein [Trichoderma citrinoviride]|uniref:WD40 repeat-like protein n=1 Tax=Trichoderma citrinoviride TaxID=58853 RepID=A0A2T4B177_9HYPO|nr:WD40 repeat-like protein [Trichoderma citrinoviride]PTB62988.1 WD40 repeat-like protein [Trichoderma citrinoviride]
MFSKFLKWESLDEQLLWVSSGIGEGMTTVFLSLVRQFRSPVKMDDNICCLSFFFFDFRSPAHDNAAAALRNLIWCVLAKQPQLESHLQQKYETTGRQSFDHANDFLALIGIFYDMMQDENFPKTCFVVDALDECSSEEGCPGLGDFIHFITFSIKQSDKVRWLISSNYSSGMEEALGNCRHEKLHNLSDITTLGDYIQSQAEKLANENSYDPELRETVVQILRQNPYCNYLWIDIVVNALKTEAIWRVTDFLKGISEVRDLKSLYDHICKTKIFTSKDKDFCKKVLEVMAVVRRPLHVTELEPLVQLKQRVDLEVIIGKCSDFLQITDGIVSFQHQSARDYVQKVFLNNNFTLTHMKLIRACFNLKWNKDKSRDRENPDTQETAPSMSKYALVNWISHLLAISKVVSTTLADDMAGLFELTSSDVCCFLRDHIMPWADALVQHELLATGASELQKLDLGFQHSKWRSLHNRIRDAHRFLRLHQATESPGTMPAFNSLLFCPTASLVQQESLKKVFPWITSVSAATQQWMGGFTALKGHEDWVRAVVISDDGKLIVSGSDDATVRIWDAGTGLVQHCLEVRRGYIFSVAISSQRIVAAGSSDYSITLWEADTGREPMDEIGDLVQSVAFTASGKLLAVAKEDCKIYIWDLEAKSNIMTFDGNNSPVNSIAFSRDGNLLASGAEDGTIESVFIWDLDTNTEIKPSMQFDHERSLTSLSFSPDGKYLLSGSSDCTMRLCEVQTGNRLHIFDGHEDWVRCVAWCEKEPFIASASDDHSVRIWSFDKGKAFPLKCTLREHRSWVMCTSFSPDGRFLVSGDNDSTVVVCERNMADEWERKSSYTWHSASIDSIVVARDGRRVVSASSDKTVHVWDIDDCSSRGASIKVDWGPYSKMWLSPGMDQHVMTPYGALPLDLSTDAETKWGLSYDEDKEEWWITFNKEKYIFLPKMFAPTSSCILPNKAVVGTSSMPYVFGFSDDVPEAKDIYGDYETWAS